MNKCTKNKHNDKFINGPSPKPVYITIQRTAGCHIRPRSTATQCEQKNSSLDKTQTNYLSKLSKLKWVIPKSVIYNYGELS